MELYDQATIVVSYTLFFDEALGYTKPRLHEGQIVANAEVACLHSSQNGKERGRRTRIRRVDTMTDAATFRRWIRIVEDWDRA